MEDKAFFPVTVPLTLNCMVLNNLRGVCIIPKASQESCFFPLRIGVYIARACSHVRLYWRDVDWAGEKKMALPGCLPEFVAQFLWSLSSPTGAILRPTSHYCTRWGVALRFLESVLLLQNRKQIL